LEASASGTSGEADIEGKSQELEAFLQKGSIVAKARQTRRLEIAKE
jgi:hypothetical protein